MSNIITLTDMEIEIRVNWNGNDYRIEDVVDFSNSATFLLENLDQSELDHLKPDYKTNDQEAWEDQTIINFYQLSHEDQCETIFNILEGGRWYDEIYEQINITAEEFQATLDEMRSEEMREEL
jgi:methionine salvage enolase-phosphatase E1